MMNAIVILIMISIFLASNAFADSAIGLLTGGYEGKCSVVSKGVYRDCRYNLELFAGDEIIKLDGVKGIEITWLASPFTKKVEKGSTRLLIVHERPKDSNSLLSILADALPFLKKTPHRMTPMITKGMNNRYSPIVPQPGYFATLLPDSPALFSWRGKGDYFLIKDNNATVVCRRQLNGQNSLILSPDEAGLKVNTYYTWEVIGPMNSEAYQIRVLSAISIESIQKNLASIDSDSKVTPQERSIRKAIYLQLLSDEYPDDYDLYWLSMRLIENDNDELADGIRARFIQHLERSER